jgi:hypothetical protein
MNDLLADEVGAEDEQTLRAEGPPDIATVQESGRTAIGTK